MNRPTHRVLVADDHSVVRRGIVALLDQQEDIAVVGQAGDGETAVTLAADLRPDVVILDVRMPGMGGVETCSRIQEVSPESRVVFFTSFPDEEALVGALLAGASGFVLKNLPDDSLVEAIRAVARGESILDPSLGAAVASGMRRLAAGALPKPEATVPAAGGTSPVGGDKPEGEKRAERLPKLTDVDVTLLRLIAEGKTNREIAEITSFAEKTIRNYVSALLSKLNLRNRAEAAAYAVSRHLLSRE